MNVATLEMVENYNLKITDVDFVITVTINIIDEKGIKVNWIVKSIIKTGGRVKETVYFTIRIEDNVKDLIHEVRVKADILVF